ncbi:unannotated protein [freshwater metagenome]|uniref:Unannotated protein n=1 Tax=freshwater metagenome TaxID=449393 RepID=A0A6J7SPR3_9ZZZZ
MIAIHDLILRIAATHSRETETVANFNTLNGLNAHQRTSKTSIETSIPMHVATKTGWQVGCKHFNDSTKRVTFTMRCAYFFFHRLRCDWIKTARRIIINCLQIGISRNVAFRRCSRTDTHNVRKDFSAADLTQEGFGNSTQRYARRSFSCAGALQNWPRISEAVLLHSNEICMSWTRSSQWRVTCQTRQLFRVDRIW